MDLNLLKHIVDATNDEGQTYLNIAATNVAELIASGLIETNPNDVDASGKTAVRATDMGKASIYPTEKPKKDEKMTFVVENIPVSKPERKGNKRQPSEASATLRTLEVNTSIFVPGIDEKKAQSLINSTERHFSVEKGEKTTKDGKTIKTRDYPRKYAAEAGTNEAGEAGVRIGRVA